MLTTSVTAEGAVTGQTPVLSRIAQSSTIAVSALAWEDTVVIVTSHSDLATLTTLATVIGGETSTVRKLADSGLTPLGPVAAASNGSVFMFAYDRLDDASGHVDRVFLDPRIFISRRRIAR